LLVQSKAHLLLIDVNYFLNYT